MPELPEMAYIYRVERDRRCKRYFSKFWKVYFSSVVDGKRVSISWKYFKDKDFEDGKEEALFFAQQWRDFEYADLLSQNKIPRYNRDKHRRRLPIMFTPHHNSQSGVPGICRCTWDYPSMRNGENFQADYWRVSWTEYEIFRGQPRRFNRSKNWSISTMGEDDALAAAREQRRELERYLLSPIHMNIRDKYFEKRAS